MAVSTKSRTVSRRRRAEAKPLQLRSHQIVLSKKVVHASEDFVVSFGKAQTRQVRFMRSPTGELLAWLPNGVTLEAFTPRSHGLAPSTAVSPVSSEEEPKQ